VKVSVIIPYRMESALRERAARFVLRRFGKFFPDFEIRVGDSEGDSFSRSAARNNAAAAATGDVFVICDADTLWNPEPLGKAVEFAAQGAWVLPYTMYYNLTEDFTTEVLEGPVERQLVVPSEGQYDHALDYVVSGTVVLASDAFRAVGGYDERFIGYGWEDDAFADVLTALVGPPLRIEGPVWHLFHPVLNGDPFNHPHKEYNRALAQRYKRLVHSPQGMRRLIDER
jgi:glycosyltransferase involved in cell wall biosynthesis